MDLNQCLPTRIVSLLNGDIAPIFLLGAGASVKSGVPLSGEMVERVARWGYCNEHGLHQNDPSVMRTDWFRWITRHAWYESADSPADNYPAVIQHILQPKSERKRFFLEILASNVQPSRGYEDFCNLIGRRLITTVLTTNFDDVIERQAEKHPAIQRLEVIQTPNDFTNLSTSPTCLQLVYLHGSVEHYTDQNTIEETKRLNPDLIERLVPLLRDHPLVVLGYRGAEPSVVKHLLLDGNVRCDGYRHGIYWCVQGQVEPKRIHPNVLELAAQLGPNFQFVPILGFDELLEDIWAHVESMRLPLERFVAREPRATPPASFDLSGLAGTSWSSLDEPLLRTTLIRFCDASGIAVPQTVTRDWLIDCARTANVLERLTDECTVSGWLLFGLGDSAALPSAKVEVRFAGDEGWIARIGQALEGVAPGATAFNVTVSGNLWRQLDRLTELLGLVNRPFRLKGALAEDVYPYAPLALQEFLTNLLVHRDYSNGACAVIEISPRGIRFCNPGGLVPPVQRDTRGESLQEVLQKGRRGIKGYRNPAISEFFLVARKMEKEGSGLPDVLQEATAHNNVVSFGPSATNDAFIAEIKIRPEQVDPVTETARPRTAGTSVLVNVLEVVRWPQRVWKAGVTSTYAQLVRQARGFAFPPCYVHGSWLWSFAPPADAFGPLRNLLVDEEIHQVDTQGLLEDRALSRGVSQLLSDAVVLYVAELGLVPRREKDGTIRAYYPKDGEGQRTITYRGRVREATRTVAKPITSRTTGQVSFWEHRAVAIKPESAGQVWFLTMLPTYVFTLDGMYKSIDRDRIGAMTTRRASRDYNPSVRHDLAFWAWVLSRGQEFFQLPLNYVDANSSAVIEPSFAIVSGQPPLIGTRAFGDVPDDATAYEGMTSDEIEEVEKQIEKEIESILAEEPVASQD